MRAPLAKKRRILVLCPEIDEPSGGTRKLYRHVDILNSAGRESFIVHRKLGFRCTWFENSTPIIYADLAGISPSEVGRSDILVVPETLGPRLARLAPGTPKVIFNQNSYCTFVGYSFDPLDLEAPYQHPEILATLVVSEDNREYLTFAFPRAKIVRLRHGIDRSFFHPHDEKTTAIAYMPRKNANDVVQVINLLKQRRTVGEFSLVAIHGKSEVEVAKVLRRCAIFLSFGHPEGFGLPPAEAMACGCVVIGYHGNGGREFFRPEFSHSISAGDILSFVQTIERVVGVYSEDPTSIRNQGLQASRFIHEHYTPEHEVRDIIQFWDDIDRCCPVSGEA